MGAAEVKNVDYVSERNGELHAIGRLPDGAQMPVALTDVRGAVSAPGADQPGYWLLMGTKYAPNDRGNRVHMFLKEGESRNHQRLIDDLAENAGKFHCREIYAPESSGIYKALVDKFWTVQGVSVRPAPYENDIDFGISLIIGALEDETLEIQRSTILYQQLEQMTAENLGYTINSLRFLLGGFQHYKPVRMAGSIQTMKRNYFFG